MVFVIIIVVVYVVSEMFVILGVEVIGYEDIIDCIRVLLLGNRDVVQVEVFVVEIII